MFLIFGTGDGVHDLELHQKITCPICGKKAYLEAYFNYHSLRLFFCPVYKWGKDYYVRTSCCGTVSPLSAKKGEKIYWGQIEKLNLDKLKFQRAIGYKVCEHCGYDTVQEFTYCPKCGKALKGGRPCLK